MEIDMSVAAAAAVDARKRQSEKDSMEEEGAKRGGGWKAVSGSNLLCKLKELPPLFAAGTLAL